jgi:hypothetical protein
VKWVNKYWAEWSFIKQIASSREVVFYGRSEDWIPKALKKIIPSCIVDNNKAYSHTEYKGVIVKTPSEGLYSKKTKPYVVITGGIYDGIVSELMNNGFIPGDDFSCCPDYKDFKVLEEMREHEGKLIISCSDYNEPTRARHSRMGGGLYLCDLTSGLIEKKVSGSFRQMDRRKDIIYAVEYVEGEVQAFDKDFHLVASYKLDAPNYCGIAYNETKDIFVLVNAAQDTISIHDGASLSLLERRHYSNKSDLGRSSEHHLNDVATEGESLYVSYFSHSGNWQKGVFDGGVSRFEINNIDLPPEILMSGLWKPHSPQIIDGNLCILDSMRGRFYKNTQEFSGEFQSFARGLEFDGKYYYIGSSEDMYMSDRFGHSNNIMLNAGFYMFDPKTKASRFYSMLNNMNIHDLMW